MFTKKCETAFPYEFYDIWDFLLISQWSTKIREKNLVENNLKFCIPKLIVPTHLYNLFN